MLSVGCLNVLDVQGSTRGRREVLGLLVGDVEHQPVDDVRRRPVVLDLLQGVAAARADVGRVVGVVLVAGDRLALRLGAGLDRLAERERGEHRTGGPFAGQNQPATGEIDGRAEAQRAEVAQHEDLARAEVERVADEVHAHLGGDVA